MKRSDLINTADRRTDSTERLIKELANKERERKTDPQAKRERMKEVGKRKKPSSLRIFLQKSHETKGKALSRHNVSSAVSPILTQHITRLHTHHHLAIEDPKRWSQNPKELH